MEDLSILEEKNNKASSATLSGNITALNSINTKLNTIRENFRESLEEKGIYVSSSDSLEDMISASNELMKVGDSSWMYDGVSEILNAKVAIDLSDDLTIEPGSIVTRDTRNLITSDQVLSGRTKLGFLGYLATVLGSESMVNIYKNYNGSFLIASDLTGAMMYIYKNGGYQLVNTLPSDYFDVSSFNSIAISPCCKFIVTCFSSYLELLVNTEFGYTYAPVEVPAFKTGYDEVIFSPDGKYFAGIKDYNFVDIFTVNTGNISNPFVFINRIELDSLEYIRDFDWSPDGEYLSLVSNKYIAKFIKMNSANPVVVDILETCLPGQKCESLRWSPDGKYLAILRYSQGDVAIVRRDGNSFTLTDATFDEATYTSDVAGISWSNDSKSIMIVSSYYGMYKYIVDNGSFKCYSRFTANNMVLDKDVMIDRIFDDLRPNDLATPINPISTPDSKYTLVSTLLGDNLLIDNDNNVIQGGIRGVDYQIGPTLGVLFNPKHDIAIATSMGTDMPVFYRMVNDKMKFMVGLTYEFDTIIKSCPVYCYKWSPDGKYLAVSLDSASAKKNGLSSLVIVEFDFSNIENDTMSSGVIKGITAVNEEPFNLSTIGVSDISFNTLDESEADGLWAVTVAIQESSVFSHITTVLLYFYKGDLLPVLFMPGINDVTSAKFSRISPDGRYLAVVTKEAPYLVVYDPRDATDGSIDPNPIFVLEDSSIKNIMACEWNPVTNILAIIASTSGSSSLLEAGSLFIIDFNSSNPVLEEVDVSIAGEDNAINLTWHPDGKDLVVCNLTTSDVDIVKNISIFDSWVKTTGIASNNAYPFVTSASFNKDGKYLLYSTYDAVGFKLCKNLITNTRKASIFNDSLSGGTTLCITSTIIPDYEVDHDQQSVSVSYKTLNIGLRLSV